MGQAKNSDWHESRSSSTRFTPEKRLALALLVDALREIHEHGDNYNEAFSWLTGGPGYSEDSVFSAECVCEVLKVDLEAVRRGLRREALIIDAPSIHRPPVSAQQLAGTNPQNGTLNLSLRRLVNEIERICSSPTSPPKFFYSMMEPSATLGPPARERAETLLELHDHLGSSSISKNRAVRCSIKDEGMRDSSAARGQRGEERAPRDTGTDTARD